METFPFDWTVYNKFLIYNIRWIFQNSLLSRFKNVFSILPFIAVFENHFGLSQKATIWNLWLVTFQMSKKNPNNQNLWKMNNDSS